jgi:hypothetical protein
VSCPDGGADWLVFDALSAGNTNLKAIATYARVELTAARDALARLRRAGYARMYSDKRGARYVAVNRRKKIARPA